MNGVEKKLSFDGHITQTVPKPKKSKKKQEKSLNTIFLNVILSFELFQKKTFDDTIEGL